MGDGLNILPTPVSTVLFPQSTPNTPDDCKSPYIVDVVCPTDLNNLRFTLDCIIKPLLFPTLAPEKTLIQAFNLDASILSL